MRWPPHAVPRATQHCPPPPLRQRVGPHRRRPLGGYPAAANVQQKASRQNGQKISYTWSLIYVCIHNYTFICVYIHIHIYVIVYIYIWLLIKIPLSRNGHSSRIKILLSRNFRELHVYLSRGPCWPTTPLMKIRSPPAKLHQRITDHFLVAF